MPRQIFRAPWHDYRSRCIYMITLSKHPSVPDFGKLVGCHSIPVGKPGAAVVAFSQSGRCAHRIIARLSAAEPAIRVLQYSIMPDHVHLLLMVLRQMDEPLGNIIARFKVDVNREYGVEKVFEEGYNDRILVNTRRLDTLFRYIRENPYRLAVRRACPDYFSRLNGLKINGVTYNAYGNLFLLQNPFKEQVVVHRRDMQQARLHNRDRWLYTAANGGVLVSPFISPAEREIRSEAERMEGRIILITHRVFPDRYKPSGHDFEQCTQGRLLIIAPSADKPSSRELSRATCLEMNALAAVIAATDFR